VSPDGAAPSPRAPPPDAEAETDPRRASRHGPAQGRTLPVVALVGRPNSGKSSLYNRLTGGDAHVGNFPGITVEILETEVKLPGGDAAIVADLPGLYSIEAILDPATDEGVARAFLTRAADAEHPLVVVQVIDSTQLALGLRLTRELARADLPLILVATQRDVLEAEGRTLDAAMLEAAIGVPVVSVSSRAVSTRDAVLRVVETRLRKDGAAPRARTAWDADALARRAIQDRGAVSPEAQRRRTFTARVDAVLLHPVVGPVLFLGLMSSLFAAVFLVADPATAVLDACTAAIRGAVTRTFGEGLVPSFFSDGILGGAGTVLAFMPQIVILTVAMELLEATGYLARGAFLVDRLLRVLGLSGRSFVPLLMGHACAVPAIAATRVIRDPRERLTTILVLPLMTCSARIPTYALVLSTFFGSHGVWFRAFLFVGLYFAGILAALVASLVMRRTATRGRSLPLVLEMPHYRAPQIGVVLRKGTQAATRFLREVGTSILAVAAILWVLLTVPMPGSGRPTLAAEGGATTAAPAPAIERSLAAGVGKALEPATAPVGFDWRINVGLIGSFGAREVMVGTMGVIFGLEDAGDDPKPLAEKMRHATRADGSPAYSTRTGLALLAFFVFACQCMSTLVAIRRETKTWRWPAFVLGYTYAVAYVAALVVYQVGGLVGLR
jgi:ferrous iron transport protein B